MNNGSVLLTGGDQPLGATIAKHLVESASSIIVGARDTDAAIERLGADTADSVTLVRADARDEFDLERLAETAVRASGGTLGLVVPAERVCHGDTSRPVTETAYSAIDDELRTNLRGVYATVKEVAPHCDETTRVLIPVGSDDTVAGTFAAGEDAISRLITELATTTELAVAGIDIGSPITSAVDDPDRVGSRVLTAAQQPIDRFDGRVLDPSE